MNRGNNPAPFLVLFALLLFPSSLNAHHILFYHNSFDGTDGALLQCVTILQTAGHRVDVVDVGGVNYDPTGDNWGPPYDQIWDMRFVDRDKEKCGSGSRSAADYFSNSWRAKAVSYLNHCGKLFIAGEHYQLTDRAEGLYRFLAEVEAVKEGYDSCPPSAQGNSTTEGEAFYPVRNGLGPATFFGAYVGGVPKAYLNGTSFVETREDWQGDDQVNRSIVSGWTGDQMGGQVNAPPCARGRLFIVWDATMWTLWQAQAKVQAERPIPWDENSWFSWDPDAGAERQQGRDIRLAQAVTKRFFPAVAKWLGNAPCPCEPSVLVSYPVPTATITPKVWKGRSELSAVSQIARARPPGQATPGPSTRPIASPSNGPETILFAAPPVNVYMRFLDGTGEYKLEMLDTLGNNMKTLYDQQIITQKEAWASWDGTNDLGNRMGPGNYYAALSKNGFLLKKIVLSWVAR